MSRYYRFALLIVLVAATLACGLITNPINDVRNAGETAQAVVSTIPVETLKALPSAFPSLEAVASALPPLGDLFDPSGEPVSAWNDIPIMPEATAGEEIESRYSFRASVSVEDVRTFYKDQLTALGWTEMMSLPGGGEGSIALFTQGDKILTVTVTARGDEVIVVLGLQ